MQPRELSSIKLFSFALASRRVGIVMRRRYVRKTLRDCLPMLVGYASAQKAIDEPYELRNRTAKSDLILLIHNKANVE